MAFLSVVIWGVKLWIWLYLGFSLLALSSIAIIFFKEEIRKKYYIIKYPEKLIKVVIHYPNNIFKEFWRLIPDTEFLNVDGKAYKYDAKKASKDSDIFAELNKGSKEKGYYVKVNGKKYEIDALKGIKYRWRKYPELHYFYNSPAPIDFNAVNKKIDINGSLLEEFKENDLFVKLLTIETEKNMLMIIMITTIIGTIASVVVLAKIMGWLK